MKLLSHEPVPGFSYARNIYHYGLRGMHDDNNRISKGDVRLVKLPEKWYPVAKKGSANSVFYQAEDIVSRNENTCLVAGRLWSRGQLREWSLKQAGDIFSKSTLGALQFSVFEFLNKEDLTIARVTQPGTYTLQWSDGTQSSFTEENPVSERSISSSLSLKFNKPWGPSEPITLNNLKSWTDFNDEKIKYYSGSADYSCTFNLIKTDISNKKIYLDLGNVQEIAEVRINDRFAGVSWIAPFILDITGFVKEGVNGLTITVVNSWINRLISDSYLPKEKRVTRTNILKFEGDNKEEFLRKSGYKCRENYFSKRKDFELIHFSKPIKF